MKFSTFVYWLLFGGPVVACKLLLALLLLLAASAGLARAVVVDGIVAITAADRFYGFCVAVSAFATVLAFVRDKDQEIGIWLKRRGFSYHKALGALWAAAMVASFVAESGIWVRNCAVVIFLIFAADLEDLVRKTITRTPTTMLAI